MNHQRGVAARAAVPVAPVGAPDVVNAMTVDVEDYFQVSAFENCVSRHDWHTLESRVVRNTERLLEIFDDAQVSATFFVLGWVGERFPDLVRRIAAGGHEVASHGYEHRLVYAGTAREFADDLYRAKAVLESVSGTPVLGYRAPSFSITRQSLWALDVLVEQGYVYDSSIYPVHHDRYGIADWPRQILRVEREVGALWELPGSTVRRGGLNLPIGGGGYFRLTPYAWTQWGIRQLNESEGLPAIFYLHPWEIDPDQPRLPGNWLSRFRHYRNLDKTEARLRRLLRDFRFGRAIDLVATATVEPQSSHEFARASGTWG